MSHQHHHTTRCNNVLSASPRHILYQCHINITKPRTVTMSYQHHHTTHCNNVISHHHTTHCLTKSYKHHHATHRNNGISASPRHIPCHITSPRHTYFYISITTPHTMSHTHLHATHCETVSLGLITNRGLVEQVPAHFSLHSRRDDGTQITWLIHFPVHSYLFSLDIVVTLVHTFPRRTRQPSQRLV